MSLISTDGSSQMKPERVIVFLIDGLHWQAPDRLHMPVFNELKEKGTYIQKSYMITPHHPTVGEYGQLHTSSFPNPVLQSGSLFVGKNNRFLQEVFLPHQATAFIANTLAYTSVSRGFTINVHNPDLPDKDVIRFAMDILQKQDIKYFRIHLQTPGNEGRYLSYTTPDKKYFRNIWGEGSPYIQAIEEADSLLGQLVNYLKSSGKWESTLLIVSSDQGQSSIGWHPMIDEDSWCTPLLWLGPGIAQNRTLPYFEHTDITPTIAHIMGLKQPNRDGGSGSFIKEIMQDQDPQTFQHPRYIYTINKQINAYNALRSKIILGSEKHTYLSSVISFLENELLTPEPFYHQDRFLEWYKAGSVSNLIETNEKILRQMRKELIDYQLD